jgi:hypothetical protein
MTTIATRPLSDTLQALVDARLDTIDRMLLGRVNRHDRLAIVREVESQIFDLLRGRDADSLGRDDVLSVLAGLDPPEAYLPDEDESAFEPGLARLPTPPRALRPPAGAQGWLPLASGVLGIVSVATFFLSTLLVFGTNVGELGELVWFGSIGLSFVMGLLAVIFAARARLRGAWPIVGLVTGIVSLIVGFMGGGYILLSIL